MSKRNARPVPKGTNSDLALCSVAGDRSRPEAAYAGIPSRVFLKKANKTEVEAPAPRRISFGMSSSACGSNCDCNCDEDDADDDDYDYDDDDDDD